ncbi:hypothetical protein LptCag_1916 [Leptospirillum ferriphilum]|uniref:Uncharacterized protein n=1 Tax=Leptospirillum ferriphilum TaxID=178606 RepID=A0A094YMN2_9BACT|nr:hypothetical protein LptCag_1916 [Leptospirillum ferriphilum]
MSSHEPVPFCEHGSPPVLSSSTHWKFTLVDEGDIFVQTCFMRQIFPCLSDIYHSC